MEKDIKKLLRMPPNKAMEDEDTKKILCVEDNPDECELVRQVLKGYEVACVASVAEACRLMEAARYALVIIDEHLLDGSGMQLCRNISGNAEHPPVIMITGDPAVTSAEAKAAGARAFLMKSSETYIDDLDRFTQRLAMTARA